MSKKAIRDKFRKLYFAIISKRPWSIQFSIKDNHGINNKHYNITYHKIF